MKMKPVYTRNPNFNKNNSNKSSFENPNNKNKIHNINNDISFENFNEDQSEDKNESNEKNNGNTSEDKSIDNKENKINNSSKYNNRNNNNIFNKTLNNHIKLNNKNQDQLNSHLARTYCSDKNLTGYSNFFLNNNRDLINGNNFKSNNILKTSCKQLLNSINNNIRDDNFYKNNNILQSNYVATHSNTKVVKIKRPKDEITVNLRNNLNQKFFSLVNNDYYTLNNIYPNKNVSLTSKNIIRGNYNTKVKKLPKRKIGDFPDGDSNYDDNTFSQNHKNEADDENKNEENLTLRKSLSSNNLNTNNFTNNFIDNKPRLTNPCQNRPLSNLINDNDGRITIVKKLPPLSLHDNIDNEKNDSTNSLNKQFMIENNKPIITPISNDLGVNDYKKPFKNITIKKLEKRIIPVESIKNNLKNYLSNNSINNINSTNSNYSQINYSNQNNKIKIQTLKTENNYVPQHQESFAVNELQEHSQNLINKQGNLNSNINSEQINLNQNNNINNSKNSNNQKQNLNQVNNENSIVNDGSKEINIKNEEKQEEESYNDNKNIIFNNNHSKDNKINISYKDFDESGWIINYGGISRPGNDPSGKSKINQDSFISLTNINNIKDFNIFGVLDGHGPQGHFVSNFASQFIPSHIINNPEIKDISNPEIIYEKLKQNNCEIIINAFLSCDEELKAEQFDSYLSGSTCVLVIHIGKNILCANAGDSRAIIVYDERGDSNLNYLKAEQLSIDYKPEIPEEKQRIIGSGGIVKKNKNEYGQEVGPFRVYADGESYPGLAMSRSIGDLKGKTVGVISEPGILEYELNEFTKYIVICSDGVWDYLNNDEVKDIGKNHYLENDTRQYCHNIVNKAVNKWKNNNFFIDNITAVVIFF